MFKFKFFFGLILAALFFLACSQSDSQNLTELSLGVVSDYQLIQIYTQDELSQHEDDLLFTEQSGILGTHGVSLYRIAYGTQGPVGTSTKATGLVLVPEGKMPENGFNILVWNHFSHGIADSCASSLNPDDGKIGLASFILLFAGRGIVVFAPDYAGLGVEGVHPYLIKEPTALSIWDGIEATRNFLEILNLTTTHNVVLWGHSQGGGASLFAHEYVESEFSYDFNLKATMITAPAPLWIYSFDTLLDYSGEPLPEKFQLYVLMYFWAVSKYEGLDLNNILDPIVVNEIESVVEEKCFYEMEDIFSLQILEDVFNENFLTLLEQSQMAGNNGGAFSTKKLIYQGSLDGWGDQFLNNLPGTFKNLTIPLKIIQGDQDEIVLKEWTDILVDLIQQNNPDLEFDYEVISGGTHDSVFENKELYIKYIFDRLEE